MKKVSANIIYSFLGEILLFFFSFLLGVVTARFLGPGGKGAFWIIFNIAGLFSAIFSMRFSRSLTYHLSRDREILGEVILYGLFIALLTVSSTTIILACFSAFLYGTVLKDITIVCPVLVLLCLSHYLWTLIIAVLEGLMVFKAKAIFMGGSFFLKALLVLCLLGILHLKFDDLILVMGIAESIIYSIIIVILVRKAAHFKLNISSFRGMLRYAAGSFPGMISDFFTLRVDAFFINYFSGAAQVGIYSVAISLASILLYMPAAMRNVLLPYIANFSDNEMTAKLSRLLMIGMSGLSLLLIPLVWLGVIPIYGRDFSFSRILFLILLPGSIFWGIFLLLSSDIEGRGFPWRVSMISVITAVATVILDLILIPIWDATGAAAVSSFTHAISMILAVRLYNRMIGINIRQLLIPKKEDFYTLIRITIQFLINMRETLLAYFSARRLGTN